VCFRLPAESIGILFVEIGALVETLFWGIFHRNIPCCSPTVKFGTILMIPFFCVRRPESIGMLTVKIGRTVKKLFKREIVHETSSVAPLE
jgi:hypothetical protein